MCRLQRPSPRDSLPQNDRLFPRRLLPLVGLVLLVLLAGCSAPGSISMEPVSDGEIAERASRSLDRTGSDSGDDPKARMLRSTIENGSGTIEGPSPPVQEGLPFAHDGAYYDLSWTVVDERTATSVSLVVDYNATDPEGGRIAYGDLPAADRRALEPLIPPDERYSESGRSVGVASTYNDTEVEQSVFVPEQGYDVVVYEGEAYRVRMDGTRKVTIHSYRYSATKVANSSDEYARQLKDEYLFTLSGLSDAERSVVEAAIDDDYYAEDDDEAFRSVLERFRRHEAVESEEDYGEWLVRYDREVYWAQLDYFGYE